MVGVAHPLQRLTKQDGAQDGRQKLCLNISGTIRDETIILVSMIWFSGTRNSKNLFPISPEDHVTLSRSLDKIGQIWSIGHIS